MTINQLLTDPVDWCSYYCTGNPTEHKVTFVLNGEILTMNLCDSCLEDFLEYGPRQ